ncbi:hypothetical protein EG329_014284 [Mollisiaceae sp. DMI_Dod_QoI]|nr:hypothetical protein EG329_014284 [Helotiales sp. DMI_Dod_QoI]
MKLSAAIISFFALAVASSALPHAPEQGSFTCAKPDFGGCCERFLENGSGVGCARASIAIEGAREKFTCNDSTSDKGGAACCHTIPTPSGTRIGIPLPCQQI